MSDGNSSEGLSFVGRALLSVVLLVGFYVLSLGIAGLLLYLPYAEYVYAERVHIKLALGCVLVSGGIIKGCVFVPRPKFEPPGPELSASDEPALFAMIREIAGQMSTAMPKHVYLIPDVNAFVAEVGGFMGIGSKRVMGIGVGLLNVDNVSELKATIAHEFGHYAGGDTKLGGFVYRTRAAIGGVLQTLGDHWMSKPFEWYGNLFLRVSFSVSRRQELEADRASIRIAGLDAHVNGLEREARGGLLFGSFVRSEVVPLTDAGFHPDNLFAGFRDYAVELERQGAHEEIDQLIASRETDPYDTHPAHTDRIAFARSLRAEPVEQDERPARVLLADPERLERDVSRHVAEQIAEGRQLRAVSWRDVGSKVYTPKLRDEAERMANRVRNALGGDRGIGPALQRLIAKIGDPGYDGVALFLEPQLSELSGKQRIEVARAICSRALGLLFAALLAERGATWEAVIGKPLRLALPNGGEVIEPFKLADDALDKPEAQTRLLALLRA